MTTEETNKVDLVVAKKNFSRIGFALVVFIAVSYAAVFALELLSVTFLPESYYTPTLSVALSSVAMYLFGVPVFYFIVRKIKANRIPAGNARFSTLAVLFCIIMCLMYLGSSIGTFAYSLVGEWLGLYLQETTLDLVAGLPWYVAFFFTVVLAPIFEELIFRKLIIDRTAVYGEKLAILFSALMFAFFHMSIQQFFYAFFIGLVLGYLYVRTGQLAYCSILHALINFFGSVVPLLLLQHAGYDELLAAETPEAMLEIVNQNPIGYALVMIFSLTVLALVFGGFALLMIYRKKVHFNRAELQLPHDSEATVSFTGIGVILFIATTILLPIILSAISV